MSKLHLIIEGVNGMHPSQLFDDQKHFDEWLKHQGESGKLVDAVVEAGVLKYRRTGEPRVEVVGEGDDKEEHALPQQHTALLATVADDFVQK